MKRCTWGGLNNGASLGFSHWVLCGIALADGSGGDGMGGPSGLGRAPGPACSYRLNSCRRNFYVARSHGAGSGQAAEDAEPHGASRPDRAHRHGRVDGRLYCGCRGGGCSARCSIWYNRRHYGLFRRLSCAHTSRESSGYPGHLRRPAGGSGGDRGLAVGYFAILSFRDDSALRKLFHAGLKRRLSELADSAPEEWPGLVGHLRDSGIAYIIIVDVSCPRLRVVPKRARESFQSRRRYREQTVGPGKAVLYFPVHRGADGQVQSIGRVVQEREILAIVGYDVHSGIIAEDWADARCY